MKTVHNMVPDKKDRIYCNKHIKIIKIDQQFFIKECMNCKYFYDSGKDDGAVQCLYDDGSSNVYVEVTNPDDLIVNYAKIGFTKG